MKSHRVTGLSKSPPEDGLTEGKSPPEDGLTERSPSRPHYFLWWVKRRGRDIESIYGGSTSTVGTPIRYVLRGPVPFDLDRPSRPVEFRQRPDEPDCTEEDQHTELDEANPGWEDFAVQTSFGRRLQVTLGGLVVLAVTIPGIGYVAWRKQTAIQTLVTRILTFVVHHVVTVVPGITPPTPENVRSRVSRFVHSIERIATNRRGVTLALVASTVGWICQMIALWVAFVAIGAPIPFPVMLFVVPVGAMAGVTPFPGGAGGIEAVLVAVLSSLPGIVVGWETALAAVVIYRGAAYWIPVIIGGTVMSAVGGDSV